MVLQRKYAETKRRKNKSLKTVTIARRFGALRPRVKTRSFEEIPFALSGTAKRFFRASQPSQRERPGPTGKRAETTPAKSVSDPAPSVEAAEIHELSQDQKELSLLFSTQRLFMGFFPFLVWGLLGCASIPKPAIPDRPMDESLITFTSGNLTMEGTFCRPKNTSNERLPAVVIAARQWPQFKRWFCTRAVKYGVWF